MKYYTEDRDHNTSGCKTAAAVVDAALAVVDVTHKRKASTNSDISSGSSSSWSLRSAEEKTCTITTTAWSARRTIIGCISQ